HPPIFASEEEALEAVVEHYQEYLAVSDAVYADGGLNPERLRPYVSEELYELEISSAESFRSQGYTTEGNTVAYNPMLQRLHDDGEVAQISFYICWDISEVAMFDSSGTRLEDVDIPIPMEIQYQVTRDGIGLNYQLEGD